MNVSLGRDVRPATELGRLERGREGARERGSEGARGINEGKYNIIDHAHDPTVLSPIWSESFVESSNQQVSDFLGRLMGYGCLKCTYDLKLLA